MDAAIMPFRTKQSVLRQTTQANQPRSTTASSTKQARPVTRRQDCNGPPITLPYWCKARKTTLDSIDSLEDLIICFIQDLIHILFPPQGCLRSWKWASYKTELFLSQKTTEVYVPADTKAPRWKRRHRWKNSFSNRMESINPEIYLTTVSLSPG